MDEAYLMLMVRWLIGNLHGFWGVNRDTLSIYGVGGSMLRAIQSFFFTVRVENVEWVVWCKLGLKRLCDVAMSLW